MASAAATQKKEQEQKWHLTVTVTATAKAAEANMASKWIPDETVQQMLCHSFGGGAAVWRDAVHIVLKKKAADDCKQTPQKSKQLASRAPFLDVLQSCFERPRPLETKGPIETKTLIKICRVVSETEVQLADWGNEERTLTTKTWNALFTKCQALHEHLKRLALDKKTMDEESGPMALLRKTPLARWRKDLSSKSSSSVIYCMVVWDVHQLAWKLYVGQAATLRTRFEASPSAWKTSHTAAIAFALKYAGRHDSQQLLIDVGLQLVDLAAAAAFAHWQTTAAIVGGEQHPASYLFVLEALPRAKLDEREAFWMEQLKVFEPSVGFNVRRNRAGEKSLL